jgi:glycosyltransferase involved in cell wall biosynthesis
VKIAFIGIKGLPGTFSGVETHVHELGTRLVRRGHEVFAYVRPHYTPRDVHEDDGIKLIHRPTIPSKHLDASVHSFLSALHTIGKPYDIVHFHCIGPGAFAPIARLSRARVVTTVHRFDYLSGKWGWFARGCLRTAENVCLRSSHRSIAVAPFISEHYGQQGFDVQYIPNGVPLPGRDLPTSELARFGIEPGQYYLYLGRLVPEKRPEWLIKAFMAVCDDPHRRLVIVGGSSATDDYVDGLKELAQPDRDRIQFTGPVYGDAKEQLLAHARGFMLPSALEGLPITLLEAMSYARPCLVSSIPPHRDVLVHGRNGFLHDENSYDDLCDKLREFDALDASTRATVGNAARDTVAEGYDWEDIVDSVEGLYESALRKATPAQKRA